MNAFLAKVTKVKDDAERGTNRLKFIIQFTAKGVVEDATAYPASVTDQPEVGEEIMVFELETVFGFCYLYQKMKTEDNTRFRIGNSLVDIQPDCIDIACKNGNTISITSDGDLTVSTNGNLQLSIKGDADISVGGNCALSAASVEMPQTGTVAPTGTGPFCAITTCPYTGLPHTGYKLM